MLEYLICLNLFHFILFQVVPSGRQNTKLDEFPVFYFVFCHPLGTTFVLFLSFFLLSNFNYFVYLLMHSDTSTGSG